MKATQICKLTTQVKQYPFKNYQVKCELQRAMLIISLQAFKSKCIKERGHIASVLRIYIVCSVFLKSRNEQILEENVKILKVVYPEFRITQEIRSLLTTGGADM